MAGSMITGLSHVLVPGMWGRLLSAAMVWVKEIACIIRLEDRCHIMHSLERVGHLATQVEVPYHLILSGADLGGQCCDPRHGITREEVQAALGPFSVHVNARLPRTAPTYMNPEQLADPSLFSSIGEHSDLGTPGEAARAIFSSLPTTPPGQ